MIKEVAYKNLTWIDLSSPTGDEVIEITRRYTIHPLIANELEIPSRRTKVELYDDYMYLILQFPSNSQTDTQEIDFIIGKDFLITTHYQNIVELDEFAARMEATGIFESKKIKPHAGYVFFYLIRQLYQSIHPIVDTINDQLKRIEDRTFNGQEELNVESLSTVNRNLLDLRWGLKPHASILESMEIAGKTFFGENFTFYLRSIIGEYEKIWDHINNCQENFSALQTTNDSLLNIRTNEIMKTLTIMAFVTFPLSLVAEIFGMDARANPVLGTQYDFWILIAIMATGMLLMFALFKHKKWL